MCVRGDLQARDETDTRAATATMRVFRMLISLSAAFSLRVHHLDVINAFVQGDMLKNMTIYAQYPARKKLPGYCLRLNKPLDGLRVSARLWLEMAPRVLASMGFSSVPDEECLFSRDGFLVLIYVDDLLLIGSDADINSFSLRSYATLNAATLVPSNTFWEFIFLLIEHTIVRISYRTATSIT